VKVCSVPTSVICCSTPDSEANLVNSCGEPGELQRQMHDLPTYNAYLKCLRCLQHVILLVLLWRLQMAALLPLLLLGRAASAVGCLGS